MDKEYIYAMTLQLYLDSLSQIFILLGHYTGHQSSKRRIFLSASNSTGNYVERIELSPHIGVITRCSYN